MMLSEKIGSIMKQLPTPRPEVYDIYWYFASERQRIFEKRLRGEATPWTDDLILQKYKFCNVFRAADRVSQYMIRYVCYHNETCSSEDRLFQIVAFRMFSKIETWEAVHNFLGHYPTLNDLADGSFTKALEAAYDKNGGLYTHAFILCATDAYGQGRKYLNHVELFRYMFLGDFMSYQIAIDLNYSDIINFSENDFTQPGPGALRGMKKIFESFGNYSAPEIIMYMVENQEKEFRRLGLPFDGLFGRPLQAIDCQGLFCETDKYCREAAPELASARTKIKAKYQRSSQDINLFFPPKWNLKIA